MFHGDVRCRGKRWKQIHEGLVGIRTDEDAGGDFTHPAEGFDIIIERTGKALDTSYKVLPSRRSSELGNDEWIAAQPTHDGLVKVPTLDEIKEMFKMGKDSPEPAPDPDPQPSVSSEDFIDV